MTHVYSLEQNLSREVQISKISISAVFVAATDLLHVTDACPEKGFVTGVQGSVRFFVVARVPNDYRVWATHFFPSDDWLVRTAKAFTFSLQQLDSTSRSSEASFVLIANKG